MLSQYRYTTRKSFLLFALAVTTYTVLLVYPFTASHAQNAAFQDFFVQVCSDEPIETLSERCNETLNDDSNIPIGDLSGDSESSLNPSQTLSSNDRALARAREKSKKTQDRLANLRAESERAAGTQESDQITLSVGSLNVFFNGRFSSFDFDRDESDTERGFDGDIIGLEVGIDRQLSATSVIGGTLSFEQNDSEFDSDQPGRNFVPQSDEGKIDSDSISISIFGSHFLNESFYFEGSAGYGTTDFDLRRNVVFQESDREVPQTDVRTKGDTDGTELWASIGIGYNRYHGAVNINPYARATFAQSDIDGYTEEDLNNSGLNLTITDNDRDSATTDIGVGLSRGFNKDWGVLVAQGFLEWEHEFDKDAQSTATAFVLDAAGNTFTLSGEDPDEDYFNLGGGFTWILPNGWIPFVNATAVLGYEDLNRYNITFGLRLER